MHGALSRSQIERLGVRLVQDKQPAQADLDLLHQLLVAYSQVLSDAVIVVRNDLGLSPTSRMKNTGTILEKLERYGGSWLKSVQDLAGMRIVGSFDRSGQDALVERLVELFSRDRRAPKVVDRRQVPMHGYAAVHVIVFPEDVPIEIQVRTRWQHEWADLFEKLADRVGRGIRYGEPPMPWRAPDQFKTDPSVLQELQAVSDRLRVVTVETAITFAALISAVEEAEVEMPKSAQLDEYRQRVREGLAELRQDLSDL